MTGLAVASKDHNNVPCHWSMLFAHVCQRGNYGDGGESNMHSDRLKLGSGAEKTWINGCNVLAAYRNLGSLCA